MGQGAQGEETSSGQEEGTEDRGGKLSKLLVIWMDIKQCSQEKINSAAANMK